MPAADAAARHAAPSRTTARWRRDHDRMLGTGELTDRRPGVRFEAPPGTLCYASPPIHARTPAASGAGERAFRPRAVLPHRAPRHGVHRLRARSRGTHGDDRRSAVQPLARASPALHASPGGPRRHRGHARARNRRRHGAGAAGATTRARRAHRHRRAHRGGLPASLSCSIPSMP